MAVPAVIPDTTPVVLIVAMGVFNEDQTPPDVTLLNAVVDSTFVMLLPVMLELAGKAFTLIFIVSVQLFAV